MASTKIKSFFLDEEKHWVAMLNCGHSQHMRHRPPMEYREWVLTSAGRSGKIGTTLDCAFCDMPELPGDLIAYLRTPLFTEKNVPQGLLNNHSTKPGTWGRIMVESGRLLYELEGKDVQNWVLRPGIIGAIAPEALHHVSPVGEVRFYVEFLRAQADSE